MAEERTILDIAQEMKDTPRTPLKYDEYWALKWMSAMLSCNFYGQKLEKRLRAFKGGFRTYKLMCWATRWLFDRLMFTLEPKKLSELAEDFRLTRCRIYNRGAVDAGGSEDYVVIPKDAHMALVKRCIDSECLLCDKTGKECKRCKLRKVLNETLPYQLVDTEQCPYADYNIDDMMTDDEILGRENDDD